MKPIKQKASIQDIDSLASDYFECQRENDIAEMLYEQEQAEKAFSEPCDNVGYSDEF